MRDDGTVKVLDFGLAKALDTGAGGAGRAGGPGGAVSQSPTITSPAMTQAGMILGTAAYMAPKQAKGRAVDKRADNVAETLAFVLTRGPNWAALPAATPPGLRRVLRSCLVKDPKRR